MKKTLPEQLDDAAPGQWPYPACQLMRRAARELRRLQRRLDTLAGNLRGVLDADWARVRRGRKGKGKP